MNRRNFLRLVAGGLIGVGLSHAGLIVPEDQAEPIKRVWPGWSPGQPAPMRLNGQVIDRIIPDRIPLMAGDSLQLIYRFALVDAVDQFECRGPFEATFGHHASGDGYTLFVNDKVAFQRVAPGRWVSFRPDLIHLGAG